MGSRPQDVDEVADAIERLHAEESRLSEYRRALHERIDAATGELIMRYRADPLGRARSLARE